MNYEDVIGKKKQLNENNPLSNHTEASWLTSEAVSLFLCCVSSGYALHHYSKHWVRTTSFKVYSFCSKVCLVISILNTRNRGLKRTDLGMDKVGEIVKPLSFSGNICPCYTGAPFNS